ncbi:hypothetical protein Btru_000872 [Bulinus truncatus]|nr:hypothetical protein Btru_000872 [Bulinus truncatus]
MMHGKKLLLSMTFMWLSTVITDVFADVSLAEDCYQGNNVKSFSQYGPLFMPNTSGNCLCTSNASMEVRWYTGDGEDVTQQSATHSSELAFNVHPNETSRRYICAEMENGNAIHNVTFDVNVLYVPKRPDVPTITSIHICPLSSLVVLCQVTSDRTQVPVFSFYTYKNSEEIITNKTLGVKVNESGQSIMWSHNISYVPESGGLNKVKCRVSNIYFSDVYSEQQVTFNAEEPPVDYPTIFVDGITYKNGDRIPVLEGKSFNAKCQVNGGSPPVSRVTLSCGPPETNIFYTNSDSDTDVLLPPVTMTKNLTGEQCNCSAQHPSGCYDLKTVVTLGGTYPPEVTLLTVNGQNSSVIVNKGDPLKFICTATGNPMPTLYIAHESPTKDPFITAQSLRLNHEVQAVDCSYTDVYYCVANNGINSGTQSSKQRSIQVYVKSDKFNKPVDSTKYNVTYKAGVAPRGTVTLYFYSTTSEDLTVYILDIVNGVTSGYNYEFSLEEKTETLSIGAIVGIAVGAAAFVIIVIIIIVVICKKTKTSKPPEQTPKSDPYDKLYYNNYTPKEERLPYKQDLCKCEMFIFCR